MNTPAFKTTTYDELLAIALRKANLTLDLQVGTGNGIDEVEADEVRSVYAFDMGTCENDLISYQSGTESGIASDDDVEKRSVYAFDMGEADEVLSASKEDSDVDSDDNDEDESDSEEDSSDEDDEVYSEYAFDFYGSDVESDYAMDWYTDDEDSDWCSEEESSDEEESDVEEDDDKEDVEVDDGGSEYAFDKNADGDVGSDDDEKICNAEDDLSALSDEDKSDDAEINDGASEYAFDKDADAVDSADNDADNASAVDSSDVEDYDDDDYSIVSEYAFDFYGSDGVESEYAFDYMEYDYDDDLEDNEEEVSEPKDTQVVAGAEDVIAEPKTVKQASPVKTNNLKRGIFDEGLLRPLFFSFLFWVVYLSVLYLNYNSK